MNQKLTAIKETLTSLDDWRELSFKEFSRIIVKNHLNLNNFNLVRSKYLNIHKKLEWVKIFTSF